MKRDKEYSETELIYAQIERKLMKMERQNESKRQSVKAPEDQEARANEHGSLQIIQHHPISIENL